MTVPKIVFVESELNTVHPGGHERAGKRIRTYTRLALDRIDENGLPVYRFVTRWFEEDIQAAASEASP